MPLGYPYRRRLAFRPAALVVLALLVVAALKWPHFGDRDEFDREQANVDLRRYVTGELLLYQHYPEAGSWEKTMLGLSREKIAESIERAYAAADRGYLDESGKIEWALASSYLGDREGALRRLLAVEGKSALRQAARDFITDGVRIPLFANGHIFPRADQLWWQLLLSGEGEAVSEKLAAEAFASVVRWNEIHLLVLLFGLLSFPVAVVLLWRGTARRSSRLEASWGTSRILGAFLIAELSGAAGAFVLGISFAGSPNASFAIAGWGLAWVFMILAPVPILVLILSPGLRASVKLLHATTHSWWVGLVLFFGCYFATIGVNYAFGLAVDDYDPLDMGLSYIDGNVSVLLISLFTGVVCAPIGEEIVFRGFLFRGLRARIGVLGSVIVSSLLFASIHDYSFIGLIDVFLFGATVALIYHRTGSLLLCIGIHALYNLVILGASADFYWLIPVETLGL